MSDLDRDVAGLLSAARSGSREALGEVLETCRTYLLMIAGQELDPALHAKGGASDLVQQTFLEAQRDFHRFEGASQEELFAWLRRVLLNNVNNFARAYRDTDKRNVDREQRLEAGKSSDDWKATLAGDTATPSVHVMREEGMRSLEQAIGRLSEEHQQVINYRYREERSFEEIAVLMNRSANAARKLWVRAIEKLQSEIEKGD